MKQLEQTRRIVLEQARFEAIAGLQREGDCPARRASPHGPALVSLALGESAHNRAKQGPWSCARYPMRVVVAHVRAAYDLIAPVFADRVKGTRQSIECFAEEFAVCLGPGRPVLDLGCGPGYDVARLTDLGLSTVGGDVSGRMLEQARLTTDRPLLQLDIRNLPFRERSFAGVWCIAALLHVPKVEAPATLAEMRRVLWPGGYVALSMQEGEGEEWNAGHVDGVWRFFARYSAGEMASLLSDAGFRILQQEREQAGRWWLRYLAQLAD